MSSIPDIEFRGNHRFEVRARIGHGAFGVVYDAFDRERGMRVAVKTLRVVDATRLLSLKNEFRAVQDLQHPNLVSLGELFEYEGNWFFTMEFVQGMHFVAYTRPDDPSARRDSDAAPLPAARPTASRTAPGFDEARLRAALVQLVRGVSALHDANKLHRDLKPSNVLVTDEGRVVVLDFGVASDLARSDQGEDEGVVGTALYMAPEQALGERVTAAADWYAVGVILYQALTGRLPFLGGTHEVLEQKVQVEPPAARTLDAFVPDDLDALCTDLLRIAPESRPRGDEILARLGVRSAGGLKAADHAGVFVGRQGELSRLEEAYAGTTPVSAARHAVTVCLHGESGVGKSFLVRRFVDGLRTRAPAPMVLTGRCHERESVPYKAIDGVVDQLSHVLRALPSDEVDAVVGLDLALLARAFPVLGQVRISRSSTSIEIVNPQERRARLFAALRGVLVRLTARAPVVAVIDDMQWADEDSLALLNELMRPPGAPPMLLVTTMRIATHAPPRRGEERHHGAAHGG